MLRHRRLRAEPFADSLTLVVITPTELAAMLGRLERSLAGDPPDPADSLLPA
jgi:hypothetical protein